MGSGTLEVPRVGVRFSVIKTIQSMISDNNGFVADSERFILKDNSGNVCIKQSRLLSELNKGYDIRINDSIEAIKDLTKNGMLRSTPIENENDSCISLDTSWTPATVDSLKSLFLIKE